MRLPYFVLNLLEQKCELRDVICSFTPVLMGFGFLPR